MLDFGGCVAGGAPLPGPLTLGVFGPRGVPGAGRAFVCAGTKSEGRVCDVLRLLFRIPSMRKLKFKVGNCPWSSWRSLVAWPKNCSAPRVSWNRHSAPTVVPKLVWCS